MRRTLRRAASGDVADVLVPIDALCRPHPWSAALFERELANDIADVRVLEVETGPVGFLVTWWVCDEVEIQDICVHPSAQRRGHAAWMLRELVGLAREREMAQIRLEVRAGNLAAIALYRGHGFVEVGRRYAYYADNGEDAILLGFALEPATAGC